MTDDARPLRRRARARLRAVRAHAAARGDARRDGAHPRAVEDRACRRRTACSSSPAIASPSFDEPGAAQPATGTIPAGHDRRERALRARASDRRREGRCSAPRRRSLWRAGDRLAAVRLRAPLDVAAFADGTLTLDELLAGTGAIARPRGLVARGGLGLHPALARPAARATSRALAVARRRRAARRRRTRR